MKQQTIPSDSLRHAGRIDAGYHLAPGQLAAARLDRAAAAGVPIRKLGGQGGIGRIWSPNRFKRAYAAPGEKSVPYLRPYDVFNYLPEPADFLSESRTERPDAYRLKPGTILQTCSGRNLGPAVIVDAWLARFVLSHDMIRVGIDDERLRLYVLAFLQSGNGQALLRRDKTGSVIDHLSDQHIADQNVPIFDDLFAGVADRMGEAVRLRERARLELAGLIDALQAQLPSLDRAARRCEGWTARSEELRRSGRIDAAFHAPLAARLRRELLAAGGVRVGDVATVRQPGRTKRVYLTSEYGRPMVSGAQLLQFRPIHLQHVLPASLGTPADYELSAGQIASQADGRAEEALGMPVLITRDRGGWLASEHIGRIQPKEGVDAGWLYRALRTKQALLQIKSCASGSVIDETSPDNMGSVIVPAPTKDGQRALQAWDAFRRANELDDQAIRSLDEALARFSEAPAPVSLTRRPSQTTTRQVARTKRPGKTRRRPAAPP